MKNCLIIVRNKKLKIDTQKLDGLLHGFSSAGYYFDKIALVSFDSSEEITDQLTECFRSFDNGVVVCQSSQYHAIEEYLARIYGAGFDRDGVLQTGEKSVFLIDANRGDGKMVSLIVSLLNEKYGISYDKLCIKCVGAPVQKINAAIARCREISKEPLFAVYDRFGDQTVEITYTSLTPKMVTDALLRTFVTELTDYIYALEDLSLAERIFQLLKLRRMKMSVAESFTGGGIASKLVEVPGISEVFEEGLNTYSNQSKCDRLGVKELTLKQCGAVSDQTAYQMAEGLLATGNCDVAVATTGIAGPKSDHSSKPVGLAYIAVGVKDRIAVYQFDFKGDREQITKTAVNQALFLAYNMLK